MATSPFVVHDAVGLASYPCRRNFIAVDEDRVIYVSGANIVLYDCKASRPLAVSPSIPIKRVKEGSIYENVKFSAVEITALAVPRRSTNIVFLAEYLPSEDVSRLRILSLNENLRMEAITIIPAKRIVDCVFDGNGTHAICLAQDSEGSSSLMCWKWELALHNDEVGSDGIGNSCGIVAEKSIGKNICAIDVCPKRSTKENGYYIIAVGREYAKIWEIDENFTEIKSIRNLLMMSKCGGDINFIDCCFVSVASHEIRGIVGVILSNKGILFSFDADTNRLESVDCRALLDNGNFGAGKESFTTVTAMCSDIIVGTSSGCVMVFTVAHNAEKIVGSPTTGGMSSLSTMWSCKGVIDFFKGWKIHGKFTEKL